MKKLILSVLVFVGFSADVLAQTITVFAGPFHDDYNRPYGGAISMTVLKWLPDGSTIPIVTLHADNLLPVGDGFFWDLTEASYIVPGVAPGGSAQLQVQAWRGSAASYDQADPRDKFHSFPPVDASFGSSPFTNPTGAAPGPGLSGMPAMYLSTCLSAPRITQHPTNQVVYRGGTASFTANTIEAAFTHWVFNGTIIPGTMQIYGGPTTLVITNVQPTNAGTYSLLVITSGGAPCGIPISSNATLTVLNNTLGLTLGAHPSLTIEGVVGQTFGIQATTNLPLTNSWMTLTNVTLTAPFQEWVDTSVDSPPGGVPQRFYRVVPVP